MKIAYLILCHKNSEQINQLILSLDYKDTDFYIPYELKDKVIVKELEEPILEKITLLKEKGYEINNTTNNSFSIHFQLL